MNYYEIINEYYEKSKSSENIQIDENIFNNVKTLIENIESNKSIITALVTSCVKKISSPKQDIRLHRTDFKKGYSARNLDTHFITPFFKAHFPKYANKETGFLTLATREKIQWNLKDGENLKIRNNSVKAAFLMLVNAIQNDNKSSECLLCIFKELDNLSKKDFLLFTATEEESKKMGVININKVIDMLSSHFVLKQSSRLPVVAIYSIYQCLLDNIKRYNEKVLRPLNPHTSSDKHDYGDINICNADGTPFEIVEIKHNIPIDRNIVFDVIKKSNNTTINRYYILTTYPNSFASTDEEDYVSDLILKIKIETNIEVIVNGIITSLKYYLRFIDDYNKFISIYTDNLIAEANHSADVKSEHIEEWKSIINRNITTS